MYRDSLPSLWIVLPAIVFLRRAELDACPGIRRPGGSPVAHLQYAGRTLDQRTQSRKPSSILTFRLLLLIQPARNHIAVPLARRERTFAGGRRAEAFLLQQRKVIRVEDSARIAEMHR